LDRDNPLVTGLVFIKDTYISGKKFGLYVSSASKAIVMNSVITKTPTGIICDSKVELFLKGIIIMNCSKAMIKNSSSNLKINFSLLAPGNYMFKGKLFPVEKFFAWRKTCKIGNNIIQKKTNRIRNTHVFKNGKYLFPCGLRIKKFQYNQKP